MKIVKRALGVCLIVVLASTLSILTTGVVVNAYIQSVLASFDIKVDSPGPGLGGMVKSIIGMDSQSDTNKVNKEATTTGSTVNKDKDNSKDTPEKGEPVEEKAPEDALPVMGQASNESSTNESHSGSSEDQKLVMTPEAIGDLKDNLPSAEKVNIFNILMSKLPQDEMQKISTAMEDGLTEDEVKELQQVIAKYVDPDEYESIMKMLTPTTGTLQQP
ncbi:hypothetical protein CA600_08265 [Paenibacillus sp. VTT E-133280]|uniref:hypothetical protein n=1 Tax=Paenibacillus sp. VTT E-133280 TaxID=1986222 RepID=UPI000BA06FDA|nr:hypothetical protein [Paenibacillus sp. VTT E-133280]OZQ67660.1 hypothetical protein CA600_08265 [Paenibacillus sp. VTT E-133280]